MKKIGAEEKFFAMTKKEKLSFFSKTTKPKKKELVKQNEKLQAKVKELESEVRTWIDDLSKEEIKSASLEKTVAELEKEIATRELAKYKDQAMYLQKLVDLHEAKGKVEPVHNHYVSVANDPFNGVGQSTNQTSSATGTVATTGLTFVP